MKLPSVTIDPRAGGALKRLAQKDGHPMAVLIRAAVLDLLERRKLEIPPADPDPRQVTMFDDPDPVDFLADLFDEAAA